MVFVDDLSAMSEMDEMAVTGFRDTECEWHGCTRRTTLVRAAVASRKRRMMKVRGGDTRVEGSR